jgi:glycosyltransferase involved in cell wall biosynthesis
MRILLLADDCNPKWPSLPIVGYKVAKALAAKTEVVVATHVRNRKNIEEAGFGAAYVEFIDNEYIAAPMHKLSTSLRGGGGVGWTTNVALSYPSYLVFEREVWKRLGSDIKGRRFDIVHRLTPMSPTLPSPMATWSRRARIPFVLGPLNGGLKWPSEYRAELAREREWLTYLREAYRCLPYCRSTYAYSAAILAAFRHTIADIGDRHASKIVNFPEVGIDPDIFATQAERPRKPSKTILFVGRLVPYKLPTLMVKAFGAHPELNCHRLIIVGDGPERPAVEKLINENGWSDRIKVLGWRSQAEVARFMQEADVFAQPSIRELGAGVVIEAMACGLPCVVVDYGGPSELIAEDRGVKVRPAPFNELTVSFGNALAKLVADEGSMARLGSAARLHAREFYTWEAKATKLIDVYRWVLGQGVKPDFWSDHEVN